MRIVRAELFLIVLGVIVLLNKRMGVLTGFPFRAFLLLFDIRTHVSIVKVPIPLSIFGIVVVDAMFVIVNFGDIARVYLKHIDIKMLNERKSTLIMVAVWN